MTYSTSTHQRAAPSQARYNERRRDHVWTEGDRDTPIRALRWSYWRYEPIEQKAKQPTKPKAMTRHDR